MVTQIIKAKSYGKQDWIELGVQGENEARKIIFDVSDFVALYGTGKLVVLHQRKQDELPYIVELDENNNWLVSDVDTKDNGKGKYELRWYVGETLAKTTIGVTVVEKALTAPIDAPDPLKSFIDKLIELAEIIIKGGVDENKVKEVIINYFEEQGKGLSTNDFTDELKNKLIGLYNYDDSELKAEIKSVDDELAKLKVELLKYYTREEIDVLLNNLKSFVEENFTGVNDFTEAIDSILEELNKKAGLDVLKSEIEKNNSTVVNPAIENLTEEINKKVEYPAGAGEIGQVIGLNENGEIDFIDVKVTVDKELNKDSDNPIANSAVKDAYDNLSSSIADNTKAVNEKYEKPASGIPEDDLSEGVKNKLNKAASVVVNPITQTGTKIAEITVDGDKKNIYAPASTDGYDDTEVKQRLTAIENQEHTWNAKAELSDIPTDVITANTQARHTHNNKDVLDRITKEPIYEHQSLEGYVTDGELDEAKNELGTELSGALMQFAGAFVRKPQKAIGVYDDGLDGQVLVSQGPNASTKWADVVSKDYVDDKDEELRERISEIELSKFPNVTIFGTPTIQQGQVSGFSANDYLEFPFLVDFRGRSFEINFAFTTGTDVTNQQNILDSEFGLAFAIRSKHFVLALSYNGASWATEQIGSLILEPQRTYRVKISWLGLVYRVQYSIDGGTTYIDDIQFGGTSYPYPKQMYIGVGKLANNFFKGIINLNYADVYVGGNKIWQGMDDAGLALRADINLENITSVAEEKIKSLSTGLKVQVLEIEEDYDYSTIRDAKPPYHVQLTLKNETFTGLRDKKNDTIFILLGLPFLLSYNRDNGTLVFSVAPVPKVFGTDSSIINFSIEAVRSTTLYLNKTGMLDVEGFLTPDSFVPELLKTANIDPTDPSVDVTQFFGKHFAFRKSMQDIIDNNYKFFEFVDAITEDKVNELIDAKLTPLENLADEILGVL